MSVLTSIELSALNRQALQAVAKQHGLKANAKSADLIAALTQIPLAEHNEQPTAKRLRWSTRYKDPGLTVDDGGSVARSSTYSPGIRSEAALPSSGKHFIELVYTAHERDASTGEYTRPKGTKDLGGGYCYSGVLSADAALGQVYRNLLQADGSLQPAPRPMNVFYDRGFRDIACRNNGRSQSDLPQSDRNQGFWGVSDGGSIFLGDHFGGRVGQGHEPPRVYGSGDCVGMLVDMDAHTLTIHRNGVPIPGLLISGLPDEVYVAAMPNFPGTTVSIASRVQRLLRRWRIVARAVGVLATLYMRTIDRMYRPPLLEGDESNDHGGAGFRSARDHFLVCAEEDAVMDF